MHIIKSFHMFRTILPVSVLQVFIGFIGAFCTLFRETLIKFKQPIILFDIRCLCYLQINLQGRILVFHSIHAFLKSLDFLGVISRTTNENINNEVCLTSNFFKNKKKQDRTQKQFLLPMYSCFPKLTIVFHTYKGLIYSKYFIIPSKFVSFENVYKAQ